LLLLLLLLAVFGDGGTSGGCTALADWRVRGWLRERGQGRKKRSNNERIDLVVEEEEEEEEEESDPLSSWLSSFSNRPLPHLRSIRKQIIRGARA
jgi:hypothetical protein